VLLTCSLTSKS